MSSVTPRVGALLLLGLGGAVADSYAVAEMAAAAGWGGAVAGTVKFTQGSDPLGDVTVVVEMTGLSPGTHGFHVHQYGDVRSTQGLETIGAHFTPYCIPEEIVDESQETARASCAEDQIHGLPPNPVRQPGDMGNIEVDADGRVSTTLTLGQSKMSLSDPMRSIVGRTVVVHSQPDDGSQPYGNAGPPMAYGVIGIGAQAGNEALAPNMPYVDKVICTYEAAAPGEERDIEGTALLTLLVPNRPDTVRMQAILTNFPESGGEHSLHFHTYGDMTVPFTDLGPIYHSQGLEPSSLEVDGSGRAVYDTEFSSSNLLQHVGRSLTIHAGPTNESPTIAAAACGLPNPGATLKTGEDGSGVAGQEKGDDGMSGWVIAIMTITIIVVTTAGVIALLFWLRMPIPFCGSLFYPRGRQTELLKTVQPPPPPRFDAEMTAHSTSRV